MHLLLAAGGGGMRDSGMASSPDVVEYICFQLRHAGDISFKKMFGEYGLYCDRKFFGLVCDNQLFVKITEPGLKMLPQQEQGSPYPGARPHFLVTELDNEQALSSLVRETCSVLAAPDVLAGKGKRTSMKRNRRS
ncbi:MAG: TfoX/Sxy family protein [Akkermansia sp.]|nr:TfoX/Sxy family protein [Akkermansia sp.]